MTRVIEFLISLLIVAVLFVVIGLFLPAKRSFSFSIETNRPMATVNDMLNGFTRFKDWNPLLRYDPSMRNQPVRSGNAASAPSFNYKSRDKVIGAGSWEIVESVPGEMIRYKLTNEPRQQQVHDLHVRAHRPAQPQRQDHPAVFASTTAGTCSAVTPACTSPATSATTSSAAWTS